jgi:hypothetical protein
MMGGLERSVQRAAQVIHALPRPDRADESYGIRQVQYWLAAHRLRRGRHIRFQEWSRDESARKGLALDLANVLAVQTSGS